MTHSSLDMLMVFYFWGDHKILSKVNIAYLEVRVVSYTLSLLALIFIPVTI